MVGGLFLLNSCSKTLDINDNPNDPTSLAVSRLLPTTEVGLSNSLAIGAGLSQDLAVYTHQMSTREAPDQYGVTGDEFYLGNSWDRMYLTTIANLDEIITAATAQENTYYAGIAQVLKAYAYSQMVDVFGDVPFTQTGQLLQDNPYPEFDKGVDIYPKLFELLDAGLANLNDNTVGKNSLKPTTDDLIYGGSVTKWIKAANTIKLKLYTQIRKVQDVKTQVTALLSSGNLISTTAEGFLMPYGPNGATDDRNPGFGDYTATQRSNHVSPWFYEILQGYNKFVNTNIPDPRVPYYIYNQLTVDEEPDNATEYRDGAFVSIYFGSHGENAAKSQQNSISLFGIYPVGGRYDDGEGGVASASSGTGAAPYRFITYADRLYLEAELIQAGVITGDSRAVLQAAMKESFKQIDYVITTYVSPSQTVPSIYSEAATSPMVKYINSILTNFDNGNSDKKLENIMTQKWLSSVGSSVDQYTDYRRTGYPLMFNPEDPTQAPNHIVQPPINGDPMNPGAQKSVEVGSSRAYPYTLPWPQSELETNPNAPVQKTPSTFKPFWIQ
ncbi:hypothetical protein FLA_4787 [Filimonas lacunae]|nr:hypothetical protein FLA_4787 [Filimonas lacunae]